MFMCFLTRTAKLLDVPLVNTAGEVLLEDNFKAQSIALYRCE